MRRDLMESIGAAAACLLAGAFLEAGLFHLYSQDRTVKHRFIARTPAPYLASAIWGLVFLAVAGTILWAVEYRLAWSANTICLFAGFAAWALVLAVGAERRERRDRGGAG
jgi:uncharacterized membrane protein